MTPITLHRIDAARNMSRFYRLDVQPDLFGAWCVMREWGRIGRPGRVRAEAYPTEAEASARLRRQQRAKQGRGYSLIRKAG